MTMTRDEFWFWFGVWTSILLLFAAGTVNLTGLVPDDIALKVTKICAILGAINNAVLTAAKLRGYLSAQTVPKIILPALVLAALACPNDASAQGGTRPRLPFDPLRLNDQTIAGTRAAPPAAGADDVTCDFTMFVKLTPQNLIPTIKKCASDINSTLAKDVANALASAQAYKPNPDKDAINCLQPGLAIVQAGIQTPAVPAQDAVPATPTTPAILAVAATPAQDPGVVLLFQKYREFTLAGALTSCQAWINGPVQATIAAGAVGVGTVVGVAAAIVPK